MASQEKKVAVLDPLSLRNTVGAELADMLEAHGVEHAEAQLGVKGLRGRERLPERAMQQAAELLGSPAVAEYLARFQTNYLQEKPRYRESYARAKRAYTQLKEVLPLLRGEFTQGYDVLEDLLDFLGVDSVGDVLSAAARPAALFRQQNGMEPNSINLYAWLRRGELDFRALALPDYDGDALLGWVEAQGWLPYVEDAAYFKSLPGELARFGVGLVFTHSLPRTVYGAIRWFDGRPLIQISDRGRDLASCWFTLFHEIGHAVMHRNAEIYEGEMNDPKVERDAREREANKFANKYLFNGDGLRKVVFARKAVGPPMEADALAAEFGVRALFAAYWLRKAQYNPASQRRIPIDVTAQPQ